MSKKLLLSDDLESFHIFTMFKEYEDVKRLNYCSLNFLCFVALVNECLFLILDRFAHITNIKRNFFYVLNEIDFDILTYCFTHKPVVHESILSK